MRAETRKTAWGSAFVFLAASILLYVGTDSGALEPEPKRLAGVASVDCGACHNDAKVLPEGHVSTKGMTWEGCRECHNRQGKTLRTRIPLNHTHLLAGVTCMDCHERLQSPAPVKSEQCLSCHESREEVVRLTGRLDPNPHTSPHYGPDLECDVCHHQHSNSENFCAQCHTWELVVPNQH